MTSFIVGLWLGIFLGMLGVCFLVDGSTYTSFIVNSISSTSKDISCYQIKSNILYLDIIDLSNKYQVGDTLVFIKK